MARVSRKSSLSPSATRGSSAIDLGKDSGVDMGRKTQPSVTSGGIGVTQEVGNIGGLTVTGGVSVEVSPLALNISGDASEGTISIAGSAEVPGGLLGISGGTTIDTNTGEIIGGSIGGEVGGFGINVSSNRGNLGIEFTYQIPFTPVEISLGFGNPGKRKSVETPETPTTPNIGFPVDEILPLLNDTDCYHAVAFIHAYAERQYVWNPTENVFVRNSLPEEQHGQGVWTNNGNPFQATITNLPRVRLPSFIEFHEPPNIPASAYWSAPQEFGKYKTNHKGFAIINGSYQLIVPGGYQYVENLLSAFWIPEFNGAKIKEYVRNSRFNSIYDISVYKIPCTVNGELPQRITPFSQTPPSSIVPPFPNPPPRKQNVDECCRASVQLLRRIHQHLGVSPTLGMEPIEQIAGVKTKGQNFQGGKMAFPFDVPKVWLDVQAKKNEKITVKNLSELLLVMGAQSERLERVLGTKEFIKDSEGKLRQSEGNLLSWLSGKNPDFAYPDPNDFWLNTDDGIIKEKRLEVRSLTDAIRYTVEAINRLERILPIAELKDSSIPARWIYPNGKGQLRVGNLIHLCEYMIRKSDKDMGYWPQKITIKAADPDVKDDEPITTDVHSQADMLRVMMQQIINAQGNDDDMSSNYDLRRTYLDIMAFQMITKNTKYLEAITEYLGFDLTEEVSKVPIPFDPFAGQDRSIIEQWWIKFGFGEAKTNFPDKNTEEEIEELSEKLLQNSELEINTIKFGSVDAKKDPKTLKESLIEILKHSSASAAAVTEVATESALDRVVDAAGIAQKLASFLMRRDIRESLGIGDLDNWISSAEKGYTDNLETESLRFPESNSLEPYGRPATQNPTIREIDTKDTKAD